MKVVRSISKGSSAPIIIDDGGHLYFVKLRTGMSGQHAMLNEWLGCKLGKLLGLPTLTPSLINLATDLDSTTLDIEIRDLTQKSLGWNIAFDYKSDVVDLEPSDVHALDNIQQSKLFLFDLVMLNIDRTPSNINLIRSGSFLYSIDYESSLLITEILNGSNFNNDSRILQQLRNSPIYQEVGEDVIDDFVKQINEVDLEVILSEIPEKLITQQQVKSLINGFIVRQEKNWSLIETLDKVKALTPITEAELKAQSNRNQERFRKNFDNRL